MKARYLFPSDYMADPAAHVFNGKLYIYPSHDRECDNVFDDLTVSRTSYAVRVNKIIFLRRNWFR